MIRDRPQQKMPPCLSCASQSYSRNGSHSWQCLHLRPGMLTWRCCFKRQTPPPSYAHLPVDTTKQFGAACRIRMRVLDVEILLHCSDIVWAALNLQKLSKSILAILGFLNENIDPIIANLRPSGFRERTSLIPIPPQMEKIATKLINIGI